MENDYDSKNIDNFKHLLTIYPELYDMMADLSDRECDILKSNMGIDCPISSLEDIGVHFGLPSERVRQIRNKAIRRLLVRIQLS